MLCFHQNSELLKLLLTWNILIFKGQSKKNCINSVAFNFDKIYEYYLLLN